MGKVCTMTNVRLDQIKSAEKVRIFSWGAFIIIIHGSRKGENRCVDCQSKTEQRYSSINLQLNPSVLE